MTNSGLSLIHSFEFMTEDLVGERLAASGADGSPWLFSALGTPPTVPEDWQRSLEWDLRQVRTLNLRGNYPVKSPRRLHPLRCRWKDPSLAIPVLVPFDSGATRA